MSARITLAVATRVLTQLRRDHRTLAMLLVMPCVILALLWWMFGDSPAQGVGFSALGPPLLALIPFIVMFLVTSVTTLRERSSGTLERLLAMPTGKGDLLGGYALAFGLVAAVQSVLAVLLSYLVLGLEVVRPGLDAGGGRRGRRRPRHGARPVRLGVRAHRVPGRAVHAGGGDPADPAVRPVRAPRGHADRSSRRSPTCCRCPTPWTR